MAANPQSSLLEDLIESGDINDSTKISDNAEQALGGSMMEDLNKEQQSQPQGQQQQEQTQEQPTQPNADDEFLKVLMEKTGGKFKSVEEILQLADKPTQQEINFANEEAKKVFEYLKDGKIEEVLNVYQEQKMLSSVDKLDTDNVLKLKIKYENPELTKEEIDEEFESRYGVEQPDIDEDLDDPADIEKAKKRFEREKASMERLKKKDLKEAKDFLNGKKQEIVLPNIETSSTQQQQGDPEAQEAEIKAYRDKYLGTIPTTIDDIVGFENKYKDSELEFNTTYVLDQQDKASLKDKLENFTLQDYFVPRYIDEKGDFDTESIAHDLYVLDNLDKIIEAHVSQAVNQTKSLFIKNLKNANYQEPTSKRLPDEQQASQNEMVDYFFKNT